MPYPANSETRDADPAIARTLAPIRFAERARCVLVLENNSSGAILAPGVGASQFRRAIAGIPEIYWKGLAREVGRSSDLAVIKFLFIDRK